MPTYEYECKKCAHVFEVFQSITARPLEKCPKCHGKVSRLIGRGAGIIFKGSGFYQTDYRTEHYKKRAAEEKKSAAPPATPETKKKEKAAAAPRTQTKE
jgi:putative FmdB family regulatory protein